jgi:hypothetical protein
MSRPARSVLVFGVYLAIGGVPLIAVPHTTCRVLHLRPPGDTIWVRLCGALFLDLAYYCIRAALGEQQAFLRWSVTTRPWTIIFLGAFVAAGLENPGILIFGVIDLLATLWTARALRSPGVEAAGAGSENALALARRQA